MSTGWKVTNQKFAVDKINPSPKKSIQTVDSRYGISILGANWVLSWSKLTLRAYNFATLWSAMTFSTSFDRSIIIDDIRKKMEVSSTYRSYLCSLELRLNHIITWRWANSMYQIWNQKFDLPKEGRPWPKGDNFSKIDHM